MACNNCVHFDKENVKCELHDLRERDFVKIGFKDYRFPHNEKGKKYLIYYPSRKYVHGRGCRQYKSKIEAFVLEAELLFHPDLVKCSL